MEWIYLSIAGIGEVGFVVFMKLSEGFSKWRYTLLSLGSGIASFYFLSLSLLNLPIGTAYGIWTGIGAVGSVLLGMIFFGEERGLKRIFFIMMIIVGVVGLKFIAS